MLLDVDGLSKAWKNGVRSHWELESGEFGDDDIPFAIRRLIDPNGTDEFRLRHYDGTQIGYQERRPVVVVSDGEEDDGDDRRNRTNRNRNRNQSLARIESGAAVNELNFFQFRSLLIENFNIRFHEDNVAWPKRLAHATPRHVPGIIEA